MSDDAGGAGSKCAALGLHEKCVAVSAGIDCAYLRGGSAMRKICRSVRGLVVVGVAATLVAVVALGGQQARRSGRRTIFGRVGKVSGCEVGLAGDRLSKGCRQSFEQFQGAVGANAFDEVVKGGWCSWATRWSMVPSRVGIFAAGWRLSMNICSIRIGRAICAAEFACGRGSQTGRWCRRGRWSCWKGLLFILRGVAQPHVFVADAQRPEVRQDARGVEVSYRDVDLLCKQGNDSIVIFNTRGRYNPLTLRWEGEGGAR